MTIQCKEDRTKRNINKTATRKDKNKDNFKEINSAKDNYILGMWKVDSTAESGMDNNIHRLNNFFGFLFAKNGFSYSIEKNGNQIIPKSIGHFILNEDRFELCPSFINKPRPPYIIFKLKKVSQNNVILITIKRLNNPNGTKLTYFMSRYVE